MNAIYKYQLAPKPFQTITMPKGAKILTVQSQLADLVIWARVNADNPDEGRKIFLYATGQEIDPSIIQTYIGTAQDAFGFVWHIFEADHES